MECRKRRSYPIDNTPREIWRQILSYLPVKSLLRCISVSRAWKSIIVEPSFASLHLRHCTNNMLETSLIVKERRPGMKRNEWVLRCSETFQERPDQIKFPTDVISERKFVESDWECVSARDGLFLLQRFPRRWDVADVMLWNPSIRKRVYISPPCPYRMMSWYKYNNMHKSHYEAFLGFDPSSNDYKVIRFVTSDDAIRPSFYVYSLKSRFWEEVKCDSAAAKYMSSRVIIDHYDHKVSVGEYIHWIAEVHDSSDAAGEKAGLVSLNLTTLTISFTLLPDHVWSMRCPSVGGSSFLGLLAEGFDNSCANWKKMYDELSRGYYHIRKDGLMLVLTEESPQALYAYDLKTGDKKKVLDSVGYNLSYINSHIESLVLLRM